MRVRGLLRALGVLAIMSAASLVGVPAAPAATTTVVSLTFDDGQATHRAVTTMLGARGMRGTFYINSALVGGSSYYMTWAQIHEIYDAGHEIGGHTLHHTNLTKVNVSTATTEVCNDRQALIAQGLGPVTAFAYPEAAVSSTAEDVVRSCGYTSGRDVGNLFSADCPCPYAETIPPNDAYRLRTPDGATGGTTLADLQASVTGAETHGGGWVPLVFHGICDNSCTGANSVKVATFTAFLDWLQQRSSAGTTVRTVGEVMGGGPPPPPTAPVTTITCNAGRLLDRVVPHCAGEGKARHHGSRGDHLVHDRRQRPDGQPRAASVHRPVRPQRDRHGPVLLGPRRGRE